MSLRRRIYIAYKTFFLILISYFWLSVQKRIFGAERLQAKIETTHRRTARQIEQAILELKGLFIKVGQMLSIMSNFLPEAFTEGLESLQDSVPPHPYSDIEKTFIKDFGRSPKELYLSFDEVPLASASLGQVHLATLKNGQKVAVKVQYPEIDVIVQDDIVIMRRIFAFLHLIFPAYGLKSVYEEIAEVVLGELNYQNESKNLEAMSKNFAQLPESGFVFPKVYWELTSQKIITLEFMEGKKVSTIPELQSMNIDSHEVATKIVHGFCEQIFIHGLYHADPHPGNILVRRNNDKTEIVLLDFGATARVSEKMRKGMALFAEGLIKKDTRMLSQAVRDMGFVAREGSFEPLDQLVDYFYEKLSHIKIENFRDMNFSKLQTIDDLIEIKKMKISFRDLMTAFHIPKDWILLERTLLLVMGLCARLNPQMNPVEVVLPYVEKTVLENRSFSEVIMDMVKEMLLSYLQLPKEIQKTLKRLNEGELRFRSPDTLTHSNRLYLLGHQFLYAFLGITSLAFSFYFQEQGLMDYQMWSQWMAGGCGSILLISLIRNRL